MVARPTSYVAKSGLGDRRDDPVLTVHEKTMYLGKLVAPGDEVFLFDAEHHGGSGLLARGTVTAVEPGPGTRRRVTIERTAPARRPLGREQLKAWRDVDDGSPEAELDFKLYRQATNKVAGITQATATFLRRLC